MLILTTSASTSATIINSATIVDPNRPAILTALEALHRLEHLISTPRMSVAINESASAVQALQQIMNQTINQKGLYDQEELFSEDEEDEEVASDKENVSSNVQPNHQ